MKIGDFFKSAPSARPVNPKPITFTAVARGGFLPGGVQNPPGRQVAATVTGAFVFIGGGLQDARSEARRSLRGRFKDDKGAALQIEDGDLGIEVTYQMFWRVLYEWDPSELKTGDRLFPSVESVRELVEFEEANRVMQKYYDFVKEEHPEGVDQATFPDADV